MSLILGEIEKVKLQSHKGFSPSNRVPREWIKSSYDFKEEIIAMIQQLFHIYQLVIKLLYATKLEREHPILFAKRMKS